jgi:hypothetical protein
MSSDKAPVLMPLIFEMLASSIFMIEPVPYCFSICEIARSRAVPVESVFADAFAFEARFTAAVPLGAFFAPIIVFAMFISSFF